MYTQAVLTGALPAAADCRVSFFAVFDGHGGRQCAEYAAEHLHTKVMAAGLVPPAVSLWTKCSTTSALHADQPAAAAPAGGSGYRLWRHR
jgi:integrin-linked kinase-associated serine/threonine phosphatase 2C